MLIDPEDGPFGTLRGHLARGTRSGATSPATTRALFIIDALGPDALRTATAAGDELEARLRVLGPQVTTARRVLTATHP